MNGIDNYFSYGISAHKVRDYPNVKGKDKDRGQINYSNDDSK